MEWFSTLTLALGAAWTSGINLYATVSVLGLLQKFSSYKIPGGLDVLDNYCYQKLLHYVCKITK